MDSCRDIEPCVPRRSARHAISAGVFAALVSLASMPAMAVPLAVSFNGTLDDAQSSPFSLSFDIDTAAVAGTFQTGSCQMGGGGGTVANVYTGYDVSGGVSSASLSVGGFAADTALNGANFRYNFDFGDLCKFHMGFDMSFASGLSVRSAFQFSATPFYGTLTTSFADVVAASLIDAYDGTGPVIASVFHNGAPVGNVAETHGQITARVPEPSTLMLFGLAISGLLLSSARHRCGAWRERFRSVFPQL